MTGRSATIADSNGRSALYLSTVTGAVVQSAVEGLFAARAINRIRRYYLELGPDAARWFLLAGHDDPAGAMASMGLPVTRLHLLSHTATMVAVVASMIGGAFGALAAGALGAGRLPVAANATVGVLVALASTALFWRHQARRWRTAEQAVQPLFPSQPRRATPHCTVGHMTPPTADHNDLHAWIALR